MFSRRSVGLKRAHRIPRGTIDADDRRSLNRARHGPMGTAPGPKQLRGSGELRTSSHFAPCDGPPQRLYPKTRVGGRRGLLHGAQELKALRRPPDPQPRGRTASDSDSLSPTKTQGPVAAVPGLRSGPPPRLIAIRMPALGVRSAPHARPARNAVCPNTSRRTACASMPRRTPRV